MSNLREHLNVLLLTADPALVAAFTDVSKELGVDAHPCARSQDASDRLTRAKYEGVMVDFDTVAEARPVLTTARNSSSNKNTIVFAIASHTSYALQALEDRAHFLLRRPIDPGAMRQTLYAAYELMRSERRRYFRFSASLPIRLNAAPGGEFQCLTINVSSNGLAVKTPAPQKLGAPVDFALELPDGFVAQGSGVVIWDDRHGKTGIHFHCNTPEIQMRLDSWLDACATHDRTEA